MRKKSIIVPIAVVTLLAFGMVAPASAFVDPVSMTLILGAGFLTFYAAKTTVDYQKSEDALAKAEEQLRAQKELQEQGAAATHAGIAPQSVAH
jgi:hypothetical protein